MNETAIIERVARALADLAHQHLWERQESSLRPAEYAEQYWQGYTREARVAIAAMRMPTPEMAAEGQCFGATEQGYTAMIDAALGGA